jgi:hypothetical protein
VFRDGEGWPLMSDRGTGVEAPVWSLACFNGRHERCKLPVECSCLCHSGKAA